MDHQYAPLPEHQQNAFSKPPIVTESPASGETFPKPPQHASKQNLLTSAFWTDWWSWEILTLVLSVAAFASLVIVLLVYNNKAIPQLPPGITFNAILSALAIFTKATLLLVVAAALGQYRWLWLRDPANRCSLRDIQLLDDASRGPWGAVALLPHLRGRWLVALGSIATILAFAIEPFVQQVPLFALKPLHALSSAATVPRALTWVSTETPNLTGRWKFPIQAAVVRGLYSVEESPLNPSCPTGNCTWPRFQSLSMCHKCIDVTEQVKYNGSCRFAATQPSGDKFTKYEWLPCDYKIGERIIAKGAIQTGLPSKRQFIMSEMIVAPAGDISELEGGEAYSQNDADLGEPGWHNPTYGFYRLMLNATPSDSGSAILEVSKCAINFCIQEYEVSLIGTSTSVNSSTVALAEVTNGTDKGANVTWVNTSPGKDVSSKDGIDPDIYLTNFQSDGITDALATVLIGTVNATIAFGTFDYSSTAIYTMYQTDSFTDILGSVARSLTQNILDPTQNFALDTNDSPLGYIDSMETILTVRWKWLSLPAIVLITTAAFLVLTMISTRRHGVQIWKTSSLPLLYHGIDHLDNSSAVIDHVSGMDHDAQQVKVRLRQVGLSNQALAWKILPRGRTFASDEELRERRP